MGRAAKANKKILYLGNLACHGMTTLRDGGEESWHIIVLLYYYYIVKFELVKILLKRIFRLEKITY